MTESFVLQAQARSQEGRHAAKKLRSQALIPAVMYGKNSETRSILVEKNVFQKVYDGAGESSLIDIVIDGNPAVKVIIQDVQYDPLAHCISHVDFHQVNMSEKIKAEVMVEFVGESPAVKTLGGILIKNIDKIEIECLPIDLPHSITVDLPVLKTFEDIIRIKDIQLPGGVQVLQDLEEVVVSIAEPRSEEELKALDTAIVEDVSQVEVTKEKEKEAAAAEGEEKEGQAPAKKETAKK
ncbi:MAG TPA: 50S ribosomal protein L25 [Patescibacteria group bacterium]|nr:50S ribosomal protein L25 [Patescibacteria group bacterium]